MVDIEQKRSVSDVSKFCLKMHNRVVSLDISKSITLIFDRTITNNVLGQKSFFALCASVFHKACPVTVPNEFLTTSCSPNILEALPASISFLSLLPSETNCLKASPSNTTLPTVSRRQIRQRCRLHARRWRPRGSPSWNARRCSEVHEALKRRRERFEQSSRRARSHRRPFESLSPAAKLQRKANNEPWRRHDRIDRYRFMQGRVAMRIGKHPRRRNKSKPLLLVCNVYVSLSLKLHLSLRTALKSP